METEDRGGRNTICLNPLLPPKYKGTKLIFKTNIPENFLKIRKNLNLDTEMAHWIPGEINPKWATYRCIRVKLLYFKNKNKILQTKIKYFIKAKLFDWYQTFPKPTYKTKKQMSSKNFKFNERKSKPMIFIARWAFLFFFF